jgi:hypothetical protein
VVELLLPYVVNGRAVTPGQFDGAIHRPGVDYEDLTVEISLLHGDLLEQLLELGTRVERWDDNRNLGQLRSALPG